MKTWLKVNLCAVATLLLFSSVAFGADVTLVTNQVPKGAYVNGSDGDHNFIQVIRITNFSGTWIAAEEIQITLPAGVRVADMDGNANFAEDVILSYNQNAAEDWTVDAATDASKVVVEPDAALGAASDLYIIFPVTTSQVPATRTQNYAIDYQNAAADEANDPGSATVTYTDTLTAYITWDATYFDDAADGTVETTNKGKYHPSVANAFLGAGLPNFVVDNLAAAIAPTNNWLGLAALWAADVNDDNDTEYLLWASQTPTLTRINEDTGDRPLDVPNPVPGDVYPEMYQLDWDTHDFYNAGADLDAHPGQLSAYALDEGNWWFYITSSATGDWVLGRSDTIEVRHWPVFNATVLVPEGGGGYDVDGGGYATGAGGDDVSVTLESGGTLDGAFTPTLAGTNLNNIDFYWDFEDVDNNAWVDIFLSTTNDLDVLDSLVITGTAPNEVVTGVGSSGSRKITADTTLYEEGAVLSWNYDIYTSAADYEPAGVYYIYMVANDGTNQGIYQLFGAAAGLNANKQMRIAHYPYFKYDMVYHTAGVPDDPHTVDSGTDDYYVISWGQTPASGTGDGDLDGDDNATITFYYSSIDLWQIITNTAAAVTTVLDGNLLTNAAWTAAVTQIGSTTEDPDTKADNRFMWNFSAEATPLSIAPANYYIIAHMQGGTDHLFVALTDALGPQAFAAGQLQFQDYEAQFAHTPYFRAETPLEGETIEVDGGDELVFKWTGYDYVSSTPTGIVQVFMVPAGTPSTALDTDVDGLIEYSEVTALGTADFHWLFPTANNGQDVTNATSGPTVSSGSYTLDVSDITSDFAGGNVPSGFYDVYYFYTFEPGPPAAMAAGDVAIKAPGVLRFMGSSAAATNFLVSPTKSTLSKGETLTITVYAQSPSANEVALLSLAIDVPSDYFTVVDQGGGSPFIDETANFNGNAVLLNSMTNSGGYWQLDFVEVDEDGGFDFTLAAAGLSVAQFQVTVNSSGSGPEFIENNVTFVNTATRTSGIVDRAGNPEVVTLADPAAKLLLAPPGTVSGQIELEVLEDVGSTVDIHVLPLGSFTPISDADFLAANGGANADGSVTVTLGTDGAYSVTSIPTGDYDILAHKDYHLDQLEQNVAVRPVTTTTVDFQANNMLLAGDIAGWDDDTDATTASKPDNHIDTQDINAVANAFGSVPGGATWNEAADFDGDSYVYISDYNVVTTNNTVQGEGLLFKGGYDANNNVVARLIALSQAGDEYTFAVQAENLSSLHAYAVEMSINAKHWELLSFADGMAEFLRSAELHKVGDFDATFASGILGRKAISAKEMTLVTMTLRAKVSDPEEVSISSVSLIDGNGDLSEAIMGSASAVPAEFALSQNYPNPFNPTTNISFSLPVEGQVKLAVYNLLGQEIATLASGLMDAGTYKAIWNGLDHSGRHVSTGMYFYRLMVDNRVIDTKKMLFLK